MCLIKKCVFALIYAFKRFLSVQKMHSKPCLQWMIFLLKKGQSMLLTQNFQVFVKFVFDLDHSFAPRNPGKTHEFLVPKKLSKKREKSFYFCRFQNNICWQVLAKNIGFSNHRYQCKNTFHSKNKIQFCMQKKHFYIKKCHFFHHKTGLK